MIDLCQSIVLIAAQYGSFTDLELSVDDLSKSSEQMQNMEDPYKSERSGRRNYPVIWKIQISGESVGVEDSQIWRNI